MNYLLLLFTPRKRNDKGQGECNLCTEQRGKARKDATCTSRAQRKIQASNHENRPERTIGLFGFLPGGRDDDGTASLPLPPQSNADDICSWLG